MLSFHFYLDTRRLTPDSLCPLKFVISKGQRNGMMSTGITLLPSQWDSQSQKVIKHPRAKALNSHISRLKAQAEDFLVPQLYAGKLAAKSAVEIKDMFCEFINGVQVSNELTLGTIVSNYLASEKSYRTRATNESSWRRVLSYDPGAVDLRVSKVTASWVESFDRWMQDKGYKQNTRLASLAVLKSSWHLAGEKVSGNPFATTHIRQPMTAKRDLTMPQLRTLWLSSPETPYEAEALSFFKFSFLTRAANPTDLLALTPDCIKNGRIYYTRSKTSKEYSVKIEPELQALLDDHSGKDSLWHITLQPDTYKRVVNANLQKLATRIGLPTGVTMYWARHTLASLLYEQGASMEVVSASLGHSYGSRVTLTYIDIRMSEVDKQFRMLLDKLLHNEG